MDDDVQMLKLRVSKFPPRILRDPEAAELALKNTGWNCDLLKAHLQDAIAFAVQTRREWLAARRARRKAERAADLAWRAQHLAQASEAA